MPRAALRLPARKKKRWRRTPIRHRSRRSSFLLVLSGRWVQGGAFVGLIEPWASGVGREHPSPLTHQCPACSTSPTHFDDGRRWMAHSQPFPHRARSRGIAFTEGGMAGFSGCRRRESDPIAAPLFPNVWKCAYGAIFYLYLIIPSKLAY